MFDPAQFLTRPDTTDLTPAAKIVIHAIEPGALDTLWNIHLRNLKAEMAILRAGRCAVVITTTRSWLRVVDSILPDGKRLYTVCVDTELPRVRGQHIAAAIRAYNADAPADGPTPFDSL